MKILQVCTGYDISFSGGITNYVRNFSKSLAEQGHEVTVLYSQDNGNPKNYNFGFLNINPILKPFHLSSVIMNDDFFEIEKILKDIQPDIIHVHMMIDLPLNVLDLFKSYAKLIISLHDYSFICNRIVLIKNDNSICTNSKDNLDCNLCIEKSDTIDNRYLKKSYKIIKDLFFADNFIPSSGHNEKFKVAKTHFANADVIIAVSNRVKEIYEENSFSNDNFIVNHIGNYTAEPEFRNLFAKRNKCIKGQKFKFGFIGNLNKIKGSDVFLQLIKNSNHEFHIYGGISEDVLLIIDGYVNVFYHGKYDHDDLGIILQNVDIGLVLPIWEDNAPQVIFEFLNAGIPIIGTKMGGLPDFINESNGVLFDVNEKGMSFIKNFINSDEIYSFYNIIVNKISGTKRAIEHSQEMIDIYSKELNK